MFIKKVMEARELTLDQDFIRKIIETIGIEYLETKMPKKKTKSRVNEAGNYTKPSLRKRLFEKIKAGTKGGKAGQWSARKAQLLAKEYKAAGGGYK
jgi:hypothetical protein